MADLFMGDDVYHNGAFMLAANFGFYAGFRPRDGPARSRPSAALRVRLRHAGRLRLLPAPRAARRRERPLLQAARRVLERRSSTTRPTTSSGRRDRSCALLNSVKPRGADRRRLVRRRGSCRAALASTARSRRQSPGDVEHAGHGPVVARRLGARRRRPARQPATSASRPRRSTARRSSSRSSSTT